MRKTLGCQNVQYVSLQKDTHLFEVPEALSVPPSFDFVSQKKGFKRFTSTDLKALVSDLEKVKSEESMI